MTNGYPSYDSYPMTTSQRSRNVSTNLYATDFFAWTQKQAALIKAGKWLEVDREHLAEEIEDMGKSEKRTLESRLEVLLMHLLKWQYQPSHRGRSWQLTIKEQRIRLVEHLRENPSLKSMLEQSMGNAYRLAVIGAERETGLDGFPETCPYSISQVLDMEFLPDLRG
jgi:hypothetical protein